MEARMRPSDDISESEARNRLDTIGEYLETLLRNAWEDMQTAGILRDEMPANERTAAGDALTSVSMAQELVQEMQDLNIRAWSVRSPSAKTA
jgi:trans-aconitate methyltransferase